MRFKQLYANFSCILTSLPSPILTSPLFYFTSLYYTFISPLLSSPLLSSPLLYSTLISFLSSLPFYCAVLHSTLLYFTPLYSTLLSFLSSYRWGNSCFLPIKRLFIFMGNDSPLWCRERGEKETEKERKREGK